MQIPPMVPLRALREAHGLSTTQLAERIAEYGVRVHPSSLTNVEQGNKQVSRSLLRAWALALNIHPVDVRRDDDLRVMLREADAADTEQESA
ncbi:helix-turn-helix domain-containing protein [Actinomadura harenae]|uniref:XRE family transcriptional regulator n=1 Tax=Actinomadura harenae TaxID=2483351 RepID=A0A3M2MDH9_9ACTN|nr:helix-turn-helix transcriptional regulator [Actinomadura harenae]RMI47571.1 XRE family transcriptional regulator [Actinomadura harenae]